MSSGCPYAEVIGDPIEHSLSPQIHGFWLERLEIDGDYRRRQVTRVSLPAYLNEKRGDPNWRGCNVTMPLKLDALALADKASDWALGAGAANILLPVEGNIRAGNTDVGAVMTLMKKLDSEGIALHPVTLLGTGGAARAVLTALHLLGVHQVRILARDIATAYKLAVEFKLQLEPGGLDTPIETGGLINATPLGMTGMPPLIVDWRGMPADGWVFDLVTAPLETSLIRAARERGMRTLAGVEMLVEQAAESFSLFFGAQPPRGEDSALLARLGA